MITTQATLVHKYDSPSTYVRYVIFQVAETFSFAEGQFVMIEAEINGKMIKKPYSIATTNKQMQEQKHLGIVVKKTSDHGMSDWLTQKIQLGDQINIKGPVGHYTDTKKYPNYLLVSVGSGLSPNLGLFQHLVYESGEYDTIVNIFGERHYKHIVPEIEDIFTNHHQSNVHNLFYLSQQDILPLLTTKNEEGLRPKGVPILSGGEGCLPAGQAGGEGIYQKGHIQDGLEQAISLLGTTQTTCFLCGKPEMVDDVRTRLEQLGVAKQDIIFEKY